MDNRTRPVKQDPFGLARPDAVVSYAIQDAPYAEGVWRKLSAWGFAAVLPRRGGEERLAWAHTFERDLELCRAFILIASSGALADDAVRLELTTFRATARNRLLIVITRDAMVSTEAAELSWFPNHLWLDDQGPWSEPSPAIVNTLVAALDKQRQSPSNNHDSWFPPHRFADDQPRPLNEAKLILVGRGGAGKTSIANRLVHDTFSPTESRTDGIAITPWPLKVDAEVRLNVWDFGGQEIMHATHQFFMTERSLYILVLNGRHDSADTDADYWLRLIQAFGGDSQVIVVMNKISSDPFDLNQRHLRSRYPNIVDVVKTDCRDGIGIDALRSVIRETLRNMDQVHTPIPARWFAVKRELERMPASFVSFEGFRGICRAAGLEDDHQYETLANVLHCLGVALSYRDDWRLRDTSVLKPEWLTTGIYKILTAQKVKDRTGVVRLADLLTILPPDQYPPEKHHFLLQLMRKFSLCVTISDEHQEFLLPDLLPIEQPAEVGEFEHSGCLKFEYSYGVLPEGLIARFIAKSHALSRDQPRWRTGVILSRDGCRALVMALPTERRIVVRVKDGIANTRRGLLAVIRYDLDEIHWEFQNRLDVTPIIPVPGHPDFAVRYAKLLALESEGVDSFHDVSPSNKVVVIRVSELLTSVDTSNARLVPTHASQRCTVVMSYAREDETLRDELEVALKQLKRDGIIRTWHDRKIVPGEKFEEQIDEQLRSAGIVLFLVSKEFLNSEFAWDKEVSKAMQLDAAGKCKVIPVILKPCEWERTLFAHKQVLPRDGKPVIKWGTRDEAWLDIAQGIRAAATSP
jgi:internalin A